MWTLQDTIELAICQPYPPPPTHSSKQLFTSKNTSIGYYEILKKNIFVLITEVRFSRTYRYMAQISLIDTIQ